MTPRQVAISGLAYDDETLVLIPVRPAGPDLPDLAPDVEEVWDYMA